MTQRRYFSHHNLSTGRIEIIDVTAGYAVVGETDSAVDAYYTIRLLNAAVAA